MELKLACADFTFPLLEHEKVLKVISMLDINAIDIGLFEGRSHLRPSNIFTDIKKNALELSKKLEDNNLKAADIFLQTALDFESLAINHPTKEIREKTREMYMDTLEFTSICKGKHVTVLPGVYFEDQPDEMSYELACSELNWRYTKAQEHDIIVAIEPHISSIVSDPNVIEKLVKDVPGLSLTLDYTHFTKVGIEDRIIEPLLKHATHFHARGAAKGYLQASFKNNTIDYSRIIKMMKKIDYSGYVGIEYIWLDWENCNEIDTISEIILLRDYLRKEYLK